MKKLLTILLSVLMVVSLGCVNVFAGDEEGLLGGKEPKKPEVQPIEEVSPTITFSINNENNKDNNKHVDAFLKAKQITDGLEPKKDYFGEVTVQCFNTDEQGKKTGGALENNTELENDKKYIFVITVNTKNALDKTTDVSVIYNGSALTSGITFIDNSKKGLVIEVPVIVVPLPEEVIRPNKKEGKAPVYDKETHSQVIYDKNVLGTKYELVDGSVVSATDAGEYSATFKLKDGYVWKGDKATNKQDITITWNIAQAEVEAPNKVNGKLEYNGSEQTGVIVPVEALYKLSSGDVKAVDAGDYSATFTLNDTKNYKWKGTFTGTVEWNIDKLSTKLEFNPAEDKKGNVGKATANKDHKAEIQVVNYSEDMVLEYCEHDSTTYEDLPVTKIGNAYYIYLADITDHWHVRIAEESKNYAQQGEKSDVKVLDSTEEYTIDDVSTYKKNGNTLISCDNREYVENEWNFLTVDGKLVDSSNYDIAKGSTDVTLKEDFINTLSVGDHTVGFHYKDGVLVEGTLSVLNKPTPKPTPKKVVYVAPKTGVE